MTEFTALMPWWVLPLAGVLFLAACVLISKLVKG